MGIRNDHAIYKVHNKGVIPMGSAHLWEVNTLRLCYQRAQNGIQKGKGRKAHSEGHGGLTTYTSSQTAPYKRSLSDALNNKHRRPTAF